MHLVNPLISKSYSAIMAHNHCFNETEENENKYSPVKFGRVLTVAHCGEEIVISGISGSFPCSDNVHEFRENLYNKVDMINTNKRWHVFHPEIPPYSGTIPKIDQYDQGFFGIHGRQADSLDIQIAMLHEKVIEAIFDAGMHPVDLRNTRTGIYSGACLNENEKMWFFDKCGSQTYCMTGSARSMAPHRLSYLLKLKGPSHCVDTGCSSSLYVIEHAFRALRLGEIDTAIVTGTNLCLHPFTTLQFARLGVLSKDGRCKPFDEQGNGYVRSETIGVLILQKAKVAKRVYAEVVYAKTNCDGFKEQGITFPSRTEQANLFETFYDECGIDPSSLNFLEAHGTGTPVGDPEECSAIDQVFTKNRNKPLLIGSVKSNMGHSEPASGICAIIKCIIGMETGLIPPNINYNRPRSEVKGLKEERMRVVTDLIPIEDDRGLIGINNFGFGGANCHVLLRWNPKIKQHSSIIEDNLPRLICISGRTEQAVTSLLNSITKNKFDCEYIKLLHDGFRKNVDNHQCRGYTIVSQSGEISRSINYLKYFPCNAPLLCFVFGELKKWLEIGIDLMAASAFSTFVQRVQAILLKHSVNILDIFLKKASNSNVGPVLGNIVVQMGLIELLNMADIKSYSNFGYSVGELLSAYCEGSLSLEETINYAIVIDNMINNLNDTVPSAKKYQNENSPIDNYCITNGSSLLQSMISKVEHMGGMRIRRFVNALFSEEFIGVPTANSILLRIGDGPLEKFEDVSVIFLFNENTNNFVEFLQGLGKLYEFGYNPQISKLYPPVELPVSRGTEMISPYIKWNHRNSKYVPRYTPNLEVKHCSRIVTIHKYDVKWSYIWDHIVDGRNIFPAIGYLYLVWETFAALNGTTVDAMQICFENCRFLRMTSVPKKGYISLHVSIKSGTGNFEVVEGGALVVMGRISLLVSSKQSISQNYYIKGPKLNNKDIYKEMRLRGYLYKGEFRSIEECNISATKGLIKWNDNWVTFMDNMLQLYILQTDTRSLYVPTTISKLTIRADIHKKFVAAEKLKGREVLVLPVTANPLTGSISSGGIKVECPIASSISRRKITSEPVLEVYSFVPNVTTQLTLELSVIVNMQIVIENILTNKVKSIEVIDEFTDNNLLPLSPIVKSVLDDQPLILPILKILSAMVLNVNVDVDNEKLRNESNCVILIASQVLSRTNILEEVVSVLTEDGFVLTREPSQFQLPENIRTDNFIVVTIHQTIDETLILLRKKPKSKQSKYIRIEHSEEFRWLPELQDTISNKKSEDIVLYTENEPKSGILGLVRCLGKEPTSKHVRCVFVMDKAKKFQPQDPFYSAELKKQMAVNIYKEGQWGTYRHLPLKKQKHVDREHCLLNLSKRGDFSSLRWVEGPLRHDMKPPPENQLIFIYYSALNFKDIMIASGKINDDSTTKNRLEQNLEHGYEFSGKDIKGNRFMGIANCGALSTMVLTDTYFTFSVPDDWSLEEAATVPVVYGTIIYGLIMTRNETLAAEEELSPRSPHSRGKIFSRTLKNFVYVVYTIFFCAIIIIITSKNNFEKVKSGNKLYYNIIQIV